MSNTTACQLPNSDPLTLALLAGQLNRPGLGFTDMLYEFYIGIIINAILCGWTWVMTSRYYKNFPGDPMGHKLVVAAMVLLVLFQMIMANVAFGRLIINRDDYLSIFNKDQVASNLIVSTAVYISFLSQSFFLHRAYKLYNRSLLVLIPLGLVILGNLGAGIVITYRGLSFPHVDTDEFQLQDLPKIGMKFAAMGKFMKTITEATSIVNLIIDSSITTLIIIRLLKSRTDWAQTNSVIKKLVTLMAESMFPVLAVQVTMSTVTFMNFGIAGLIRLVWLIQSPIVLWAVVWALSSRLQIKSFLFSSHGASGAPMQFSQGMGKLPSYQLDHLSKHDTKEADATYVAENSSSHTLPLIPNNGVLVQVEQTTSMA